MGDTNPFPRSLTTGKMYVAANCACLGTEIRSPCFGMLTEVRRYMKRRAAARIRALILTENVIMIIINLAGPQHYVEMFSPLFGPFNVVITVAMQKLPQIWLY